MRVPRVVMPENPRDDIGLLDEREDAHGGFAVGTFERVNLPDLLNEPHTARAVGVVAVVANEMFVLVGDVDHELTASHFNAGMSW